MKSKSSDKIGDKNGVKILPITEKLGRTREKNYKTKIAQAIAEIIDNPYFPQKRIENAYPDLSEKEVEEKYIEFARKWAKVRHDKKFGKKSVSPEKAKGLSLDDFASMTSDFLGGKGANRDIVNRVLHTGDDSVQVRSRKVNERAILIISHFSDKYTFQDLLNMAAEAIANSKKTELFKQTINTEDYSTKEIERMEKKQETEKKEEKLYADMKLANLVEEYTNKFGYEHLLSEIMKISGYEEKTKAKALVFDLLTGEQPPIAVVVILSKMLEISAEKMLEIVKRSFILDK